MSSHQFVFHTCSSNPDDEHISSSGRFREEAQGDLASPFLAALIFFSTHFF